ncbi:MAG: arsenosugar biosynthesis radical SAM (seleno)protein ArsS [Flavobacteriaceae bacterium]
MPIKSLQSRSHLLSSTQAQLQWLENGIFKPGGLPSFAAKVNDYQNTPLRPRTLEILQLNLGYMCNQVCTHCHVDAGPDRKEMMSEATLEKALDLIRKTSIKTLDLTGGAPEMHPYFREFVTQAAQLGIQDLIVRSNLTILLANKKYADLPEFFKTHNVHIVSSLPFYKKEKTDRQRGSGVFLKSIEALKRLNAVGYGKPNTNLKLDLVYNPSGAFLPGNQKSLELEFKKALKTDFDIDFNQLFTITNMPISRYLDFLIASENYDEYMESLVEAFNPAALDKVMCTNTLSVRWDGYLYDCDFNQMLDLKVNHLLQHIDDFSAVDLLNREICVSQHCYGCTAGSGSSCQGSVV